MEIGLQYLIGSGIALLGLGVTIGFKIAEKKPDVQMEDFFCKLAHFKQPTRPKVVIKNGNKTTTTCSYFIEKNKKCTLTNDNCIIFKNFSYDTKYADLIESFKYKKLQK